MVIVSFKMKSSEVKSLVILSLDWFRIPSFSYNTFPNESNNNIFVSTGHDNP